MKLPFEFYEFKDEITFKCTPSIFFFKNNFNQPMFSLVDDRPTLDQLKIVELICSCLEQTGLGSLLIIVDQTETSGV